MDTPERPAADAPTDFIVTPDIEAAVQEAQLLVAYVGHAGTIDFDPELLDVFITSKFLIRENKWTPEAEAEFWSAYDRMAALIKPVTIESLRSTMPVYGAAGKGKNAAAGARTNAAAAVFRYRILASLALFFLLLAQIYWIVGAKLNRDLEEFFQEIETIETQIQKLSQFAQNRQDDQDQELRKLETDREYFIQQFGATYKLLQSWNRVWQTLLFIDEFEEKVTPYAALKYEEELKALQADIRAFEASLKTPSIVEGMSREKSAALDALLQEEREMKLAHERDKARHKLFLTRISSDFTLNALQIYFLPLLYGMLGACTYVLRRIARDIRDLTYSYDAEIRYRLRLALGALAGMAVGWFLDPAGVAGIGNFSPLALAFLAGYNVEVFFSMMDKLVEALNNLVPSPDAETRPPEKTPPKPPAVRAAK